MSKKLKFIWIDDDSAREQAATNMGTQLGVNCTFIDVRPKGVDYISMINKIEPDLILIDHNLTKIGTGDIKKGSTIAALIREKHPKYPIACITGAENNTVDSQQRLAYEAVFSFDDIKKYYSTMKSIAKSYVKLSENKPKNVGELIELLKAPSEEIIKLTNIIPHKIKENFNDKGLFANVSHWIRNVLIDRPGFLYDRLWAATLLGLNDNGFKKVEKLFASAKYKGLFADESKERWWKSELLDILSRQVDGSGLPWEKGRSLNGINSRNYSKDFYSNYKEEYPEVVAYTDDTSNEREPMKLKYTVPHPKYEKLLFFEEIRMMKTEE